VNCPDEQTKCPDSRDKTAGQGLAHAYRESGTCPVPIPVPMYPGDVPRDVAPCQDSRRHLVWTDLDRDFNAAVVRRSMGWTTVWVMHRSRRQRTGSWRVSWSEREQRFAKAFELQNMRSRFPHLEPLVEAYVRSTLARTRAFAQES
jgi:hypothetical protein